MDIAELNRRIERLNVNPWTKTSSLAQKKKWPRLVETPTFIYFGSYYGRNNKLRLLCINYSVSFSSYRSSFICCFIVIRNATIKSLQRRPEGEKDPVLVGTTGLTTYHTIIRQWACFRFPALTESLQN
jgi:hypothetical protein